MYKWNGLQTEVSRRRETEVMKIKKDFDLAMVQHESAEASLRKRHTDAVNELTDQVEYLTRGKSKSVDDILQIYYGN